MQVGRALWESIQDLVAADTAFLAAAAANKVHLVIASFVPSLDLDPTTLTLATFTGSAALSAVIGVQDVFYDPLTGTRAILVKSPAGGWTWNCTVTPGAPETVYGWVMKDNAGTGLVGSGLLTTPVPISTAGQGVIVPEIRIDFSTSNPT